ncbi:MAG: hypothetical protein SP4CHLAM5_03450 [Chlamydiia bacterium]|nr:hypothetical protein [Chlamydiia bacterium]MCH9618219.1 hypothetical protein [Chlamydiia bacterium]MCH9624058.1 hypothetical protein [Chlamydiia bacterium]
MIRLRILNFKDLCVIIKDVLSGAIMNKQERKDLARLESKLDILEAEISHLDTILRKSGFPQGIATLTRTVEEILSENENENARLDDDGMLA